MTSLISKNNANKTTWSCEDVKLQAHVNLVYHNPFGHAYLQSMWNAADNAVQQAFDGKALVSLPEAIEMLNTANQAAWAVATGD